MRRRAAKRPARPVTVRRCRPRGRIRRTARRPAGCCSATRARRPPTRRLARGFDDSWIRHWMYDKLEWRDEDEREARRSLYRKISRDMR